MTLLPSLFSSRNRPMSLFSRGLIGELEDAMNEMFQGADTTDLGWNGKRFAIDVEEQDDQYIVNAEIAGSSKDNVEVTLKDRLLTIQVKESGEKEEEKKNFLYKERWTGSASRSITLPHAADEEDVKAVLRDGVLSITVKKDPEAKTKKIAVH